jgi:nucleoside-diphosphate-sugar epimerase
MENLGIKGVNMKILVTGHKGYIGSHLIGLLKEEGYNITGVDLNLFDGCNWDNLIKPDKELLKDFRDLSLKELEGHDCIMHLAAISNDPMGELDEGLTYDVNFRGSVELAKKAKKVGIPRFLFASSCSVYGKGETLDLDENAKLNPLSAYAISKVQAEIEISKLADNNFSPTFLRNATAYGYSPMLRIDLVVNNLLACAFTKGEIRIMSDGTPWRPLIHSKDIARAFIAFAKTPIEKIFNKAINIGANSENYQVRDIANKVKKLIPNASIIYTGKIGADPRNYRVKFNLLNSILPEFKLEYSLYNGMEELYKEFIKHKFSVDDFIGSKFIRIKALQKNIHKLRKGK